MKKFLLFLAAAAVTTGAYALPTPQVSHARQANRLTHRADNIKRVENKATRQSQHPIFRAADNQLSMNWGYCEGATMAIPMEPGQRKEAIILTADLATQYAGAELSAILVANPVDVTTMTPNYEYDNPIKEATVWLSESLDAEPFVSATAEMGSRGFDWTSIDLPQSYIIEAGKEIVIGVTMDIPQNDNTIYSLITDYGYPATDNTCFVYTSFSGFDDYGWLEFKGEPKWQKLGADFGNLSLRAHISGDMLPTDIADTYAWSLPMFAIPDEPFDIYVAVKNFGANDISSVEYTIQFGDEAPVTTTLDFDPALGYFDVSNYTPMSVVCPVRGNNIPCKVGISAINGNKLPEMMGEFESALLCIEEGFPRNVVVEEATGTWCGWCVIGYAGMEYMAENYTDQGFIGIAVHDSDPMEVMGPGEAYADFAMYVTGFPSSYFNRDMANDVYPDPYYLEEYFDYMKDVPAYAQISATLEPGENDKTVTLHTTTVYGGSENNARYQIAYTVVENGVGPYVQSNYCSGLDEDCYGFEDMPEAVPLTYNDVARNCSKPMGIEGSQPAEIVANQEYTFETEITLSDVNEPKNASVVAMVINRSNGAIENATLVKVADAGTGVGMISDNAKAEVFTYGGKGTINFRVNAAKAIVYTADGRCVAKGVKGNTLQVPAGVYVVSLNGKTSKVVVR